MSEQRELDRLLEAARLEEPGAERRARVRERVLAATVMAGVVTTAASASAASTLSAKGVASGWSLAGALKLCLCTAAVLATASGALWLALPAHEPSSVRARQASSPSVVPVPPPRVEVPPASPPALRIEPLSTPARGDARPHRARAAGPRARRSMTEEAELLAEALAALGRRDPASALRALASHERRFPHGTLAPERAAARIRALCALGEGREAADARAAFLRDFPGSALRRALPACGP